MYIGNPIRSSGRFRAHIFTEAAGGRHTRLAARIAPDDCIQRLAPNGPRGQDPEQRRKESAHAQPVADPMALIYSASSARSSGFAESDSSARCACMLPRRKRLARGWKRREDGEVLLLTRPVLMLQYLPLSLSSFHLHSSPSCFPISSFDLLG